MVSLDYRKWVWNKLYDSARIISRDEEDAKKLTETMLKMLDEAFNGDYQEMKKLLSGADVCILFGTQEFGDAPYYSTREVLGELKIVGEQKLVGHDGPDTWVAYYNIYEVEPPAIIHVHKSADRVYSSHDWIYFVLPKELDTGIKMNC